MTTKKRLYHFDLLKGIAIFLVVMGHVLTMCVRGIDSAFIFKLIGQVHMPLFFFISGYFTYKAGFARPALGKRAMQLLVPLAVVTPLWVTYFPHSGLQSPLSDNLAGLWHSYWKDGYWFTLCLMQLVLVYAALGPALRRLAKTWQHIAVLLAAYGALVALAALHSNESANADWLGLGLLARFFPIFMMGAMAHKLQAAWQRAVHSQLWLTAALVAAGPLLYATVYPWDMPWSGSPELTAWLGIAIVPLLQLCIVVLAIAMVEPWSQSMAESGAKPGPVARATLLLGNESLGIYLLHYFFLFPLTGLQEPLRAMGLQLVPLAALSAAVAACVIACVLLAIALVKRSHIAALLLIGQPLPRKQATPPQQPGSA